MASSFEKFQKRRLISSYFSVILSMFIVLSLLGILGLFVVNSGKISNDFKENIPMSVYFKNEANDSVLKGFGEQLSKKAYIKDYVFVSKEDAAENNKDIVGEDFMEFLGTNPLPNSYDLHLQGDYEQPAGIKAVEMEIKSYPMVDEVTDNRIRLELANNNLK